MPKKFKKGDIVRHIGFDNQIDKSSVGVVVGYEEGRNWQDQRVVKVIFCFDGSYIRKEGMIASRLTYAEDCLILDVETVNE